MTARRMTMAAVALATTLFAGHGRATSLADAMVEAYLSSPEITAQRANVRIASEGAVQARAGGRPVVSGTIDIAAETRNTDNAVFPTTLALNATQPLYTGGQVANATEAAEKRITGAEVLLIATEQIVLLDTVTAFADVLRDLELVEFNENTVRVLSEQLRAAEERFEVGEVTRTDVEQARARLSAAQASLAAQRGALETSRQAYARVVGRAPGILKPLPPIPELPDAEDAAVAIALRNEPNLVAARIERDASGSDVRAAIGALLPQIAVTGSLSQVDTFDDPFDGTQAASVGLTITLPFYTGGANYSAVRQQQAEVEVADANITSAIRDVIEDVGNAWSALRVSRAEIRAGQLEVRAAQLAFEGVQEEAKVGARTTLDVLDAEEEVLEAKAGLAAARRDEYVAAYALLESMGMLTIDHLGLDLGAEAEPAAYYDTVRDRNFGYDKTDDTVWSYTWRP